MFKKTIIFIAVVVTVMNACKKTEQPFNSPDESQFQSHYCNDPVAINYNFNFPGIADNSTCVYPTDVFHGSYSLKDSIYNADYELDTILDYTINFHPQSLTKLLVSGFCIYGDSIEMTAGRYYKASADSTDLADSTKLTGQVFCRTADTLSGTISKYANDSNKIRINIIISSDTGINFHIGTGKKI